MQTVTLNIGDEKELYNSFDPDLDLLSDDVKSYLWSKLQLVDRPESLELHVCSDSPINEERFKSAMSKWIDDEDRSLHLESCNWNRV